MTTETIKIAVLGGSNVGKHSLAWQFIHSDSFNKDNQADRTIDTKYTLKNAKEIKVRFFVEAECERFPQKILNRTVKSFDGAILIFDLTNPASFELIKKFYEILDKKDKKLEKFVFAMFGNKDDLENKVDPTEIKKLKDTSLFNYFQGSAKNDIKVNEIKEYMIETIYARLYQNV